MSGGTCAVPVDLELSPESPSKFRLFWGYFFSFFNETSKTNADVSCPSLFSHGHPAAAGHRQPDAGSLLRQRRQRPAQPGRPHVPVRQHPLPAAQSSVGARRVEVGPGCEEEDEARAQVREVPDGGL